PTGVRPARRGFRGGAWHSRPRAAGSTPRRRTGRRRTRARRGSRRARTRTTRPVDAGPHARCRRRSRRGPLVRRRGSPAHRRSRQKIVYGRGEQMLGLSTNQFREVSRMAPSLDELVTQGEGAQDAVDLGGGVFMSRNIANSYLVTTPDGDVLINTGTEFEAA